MARRVYKQNNPGTEDSEVITEAFNEAYREYTQAYGPVTVNDLLMSFDGDKSALARALAEATGTKYASQMKNISRWLNYEKGLRGAQARNPANSRTSERFTDLYTSRNPPPDMSITITGWIGYDTGSGTGDFRLRTVTVNSSEYRINTGAFIIDMKAGNTHAAYREVFANYAPLIVASADHIDLSFS
jgi:hypothetical protein